MKLLILSSLLALALGSSDVSSERDLGLTDYQVNELGLGLIGGPPSDSFKLAALHGPGGDAGLSRYIYLFKQCPHGAGPDQAKTANPNFLGRIATFDNGEIGTPTANWIQRVEEVSTDVVVEGLYSVTEIGFKVLPAAIEIADITTPLEDTATSVERGCVTADCAEAAVVTNYEVEFCALFGVGPAEESNYPSGCQMGQTDCFFPKDQYEVYGFREIILKAQFTFDGNFECVTFETQAYDPLTGDAVTTKQYQAVASNCSPVGSPIRPGLPICIEICSEPGGKRDAFIDLINNMYFCEESVPTTSAPDNTFIMINSNEMYPMLEVICDDENERIEDEGVDTLQMYNWGTRLVGFGCCRTSLTLPARYFATVEGTGAANDGNLNNAGTEIFNPTNPTLATFKVCGDVDIWPFEEKNGQWGPDGYEFQKTNGADKVRRGRQTIKRWGRKAVKKAAKAAAQAAAGGTRRLQESTTVIEETGALSGDLAYTLAPADDSSSKKTFAAGAAAIGALGAALLI